MAAADHALVAPSGTALTMACAASLLLQFMVAEPPKSEEQLEGDAWHWHARQYATGNKLEIGAVFKSGGKDWTVDIDMLTGSKMWAAATSSAGRFEDPVAVPQVHPQCYGTPDYWSFTQPLTHETSGWLEVKDYKAGHRYVDPWENWQLILYALGVAHRLGLIFNEIPVVLTIVQPRAYHRDGPIKLWRTTLGNLRELAKQVIAQLEVALLPNAPTKTGVHCIDCKARLVCNTLQRGAMHIVQFSGVGEAVELPNDALGAEARILLEASQLLNARLDGLKTQIEVLMRSGVNVPYWKMEPGRALLRWNDGITVEDIRSLGVAAEINTIQPSKPITPTQAKDAGVDEKVLAFYATRLPSGMTLKPDSTTHARKVFAK